MLDKIKKIAVIIVIAILFSMFCFSLVDVAMERPDYSDFCSEKSIPLRPVEKSLECPNFSEPSESEEDDCYDRDGFIEYSYDEKGCPKSFECNTCRASYEGAGKGYRLTAFIITSILGIIAIVVGMYVRSKNEVVEWVMSGIIIGGIATIFIGTMQYFQDMGRFVKPIVLLVEMAIIIWVAVKTFKKK
jgi:uncharacterized protein (DUF983 family)